MRKKLFAILMSAMMMVTFMPAMAFAATSGEFTVDSYAADYSTVTGHIGTDTTDVVTVPATRTMNQYGQIEVLPDVSAYKGLTDNTKERAYYYDLSTMSLTGDFAYSVFDKTDFDGLFTETGTLGQKYATLTSFNYKAPSYVTNPTYHIEGRYLAGYEVTMNKPAYDETSYAEQKFTAVPLQIVKNSTPVDVTDIWNADVIGTAPTKDFTVKARTATIAEAFLYVDKAKDENEIDRNEIGGVYDGAEHQIVMNTLPGVSVSFELLNAKTGKYEAVEKASFKNVGEYNFRATIVDSKKGKKQPTFKIVVEQAKVNVGFVPAAGLKVTTGIEYDPYDFIEVVGEHGTEGPAAKAEAAAVKADNATLKAWFKEVYDVTATPVKYDSTHVDLAIVAKELTPAEEKAIATKYADLLKNFDIDVVTGTDAAAQLEVTNGANLHNEVEFVSAPTSKTYKAKKLKKAAKSFTVKAEALSGATVSYKLINANSKIKIDKASGKITLKKGLKKGTYKIKVKAWVNAGKGYAAADETQAIKIKVK
ncbi:MAG: hypothetical protein KBS56_02960 [Clostridiales bacterium]|nr:hypothetical protein [Candidatus Crickella equi]